MPALLQTPFGNRLPRVVSASGTWLTLDDGRRVLDADGGAACASIGHAHPRVVEALAQQAATVAHAWSGSFGSAAADELSDMLLADAPGGLSHAFFAASGSEAIEAALKLARQYFLEVGQPQRDHIIGRRQSFHGVTLGALSVSGHPLRRRPFQPLLCPNFTHVSPCFPLHYRERFEDDAGYVARLHAELDAEFIRVGPDRVAAFCAETVVGGTLGAVAPVPGYFAAMREVCDRHGALLILDEVMCGMGRTGSMHAWQCEGIRPDIQTVGKSLGGGYVPISATLFSRSIADALARGSRQFTHGHTYQAHPLACAAAIAVQNIVRDEGLVVNSAKMGALLLKALAERLGNAAWTGEVRGRGLLIGVEFLRDPGKRAPFAASLGASRRVKAAALDNGVVVFAGSGTIDGESGDHIFLAPPFNIANDEVEEVAERVSQAAEFALDPLMS